MRVRRNWAIAALCMGAAATLLIAARLPGIVLAGELENASPAPEFTHTKPQEWINSPPLTLAGLRGEVVLLDFWSYGCWNCYRSFPWLKSVEARHHRDGLRVIGVHTPEFKHERARENVVQKVADFGLPHPVMMDNDYSYWKAMSNRYWPAFYLIDKQGRTRYRFVGETHAGDRRAEKVEAAIRQLLAETP